ncbi:MAG: VWA domain-containing protein [Candidatus Aminicenantia bacterium]
MKTKKANFYPTTKVKMRNDKKSIWMVFILLVMVGILQSILSNPMEAATGNKKLVVILDASGSMWGQVDGKAKIDIAREVLTGIIRDLPENIHVGLTAYGHRKKDDCNDVEELVAVGPQNREKLLEKLRSIQPKGKTLISLSVEKTAEKLKNSEEEFFILLVSDGKETCASDPCEVVKKLKSYGIQFRMYVIGFDVTEEEKAQLSCMTKAGGGEYYPANNARQFKNAFQKITDRVTVGEGPGKLELSKTTFAPLEKIVVKFTAQPDYASNAWVGIIPSHVSHGDEVINDQHDLSYQHLNKKISGTLIFTAPKKTGGYDLRMFNSDAGGKEVASVTFKVEGQLEKGSLKLDKTVYEPGEEIRVEFKAKSYFKPDAWIGIIPSWVPHGKEVDADAHDLTYQKIHGRLEDTMVFRAPTDEGSYDIRMFDTDYFGDEVASVSFEVKGKLTGSLRCEPTVVKPGGMIKVHFETSTNFAQNAWIGIIPSHVPHGSESVNDQHDLAYQYLNKRISGTLTFKAPTKPGSYDFRMHDTDNNGKEVASVTFIVK